MNGSSPQPLIVAHAVDCSQVADWSREAGWDIEYQQIGRGAFDAWFRAASCRELTLTDQVCNREMVICGGPARDRLAVVLPSGTGPLGTYEGRALRWNDAIALYPGDGRVLRSPSGFRTCTVSIPRTRLEAALWHHAGCEPSALWSESRPFSISPGRLRELVATIRSLAGGDPALARTAATAELEDRILRLLAMSLCEEPGDSGQSPRRGVRADYVRRARDYIEAHLDEAIPLSRVAAHAGVSTRTLELAFQDVLGATPTGYILSRRLNKARRHLLEKSRETGTLADLALESGLSHFGRFSRDYRALFGELPSETRDRSQGVGRSPEASGAPDRRP